MLTGSLYYRMAGLFIVFLLVFMFSAQALTAETDDTGTPEYDSSRETDDSGEDDEDSEAEKEFEWDEDNKDTAVTVWESTDWAEIQSRLNLSGFLEPSAKATADYLDDAILAKKAQVESILKEDDFGAVHDYKPSMYTYLVLAMIQVLAENDGVIQGNAIDDPVLLELETGSPLNKWFKTFGREVRKTSPASDGKWTFKSSVQALFLSYTESAQICKNESGTEPHPCDINNMLKIAVEGTVMHTSSKTTGHYAYRRSTYGVSDAKSFYSAHKASIDTYYKDVEPVISEEGDDPYAPDPAFAYSLCEIYHANMGYGGMSEYSGKSPTEAVAAFLKWLDGKRRCSYSQTNRLGPDSYDCSGLIYCGLKESGAAPGVPDITTGDFHGNSFYHEITQDQLMPGDILHYSKDGTRYGKGHVMVYLGRPDNDHYRVFDASSPTSSPQVGERDKKISGHTWNYYRWWSQDINTAGATAGASEFVNLLESYNLYVKNHASHFDRNDGTYAKNFKKVKSLVKNGDTVQINCSSAINWALRDMGVTSGQWVWGDEGRIKNVPTSSSLTHMTGGGPVGRSVKEAVKGGLLKPGDIVVVEGRTHIMAYSGQGGYFYSGGSECQRRGYSKVGICLDCTTNGYKNLDISEVLRWK